ncbi:hypothetical protein HNR46_001198 [Haloferula luteola]|uniref:Uncharacterized protein n=1 Tax=Haloferula luteola TaxID=595692 RepID=A0A840V5Q9_9BACT|nr:hypothetical protein [Haloferula luteola]
MRKMRLLGKYDDRQKFRGSTGYGDDGGEWCGEGGDEKPRRSGRAAGVGLGRGAGRGSGRADPASGEGRDQGMTLMVSVATMVEPE